MEDSMTLKEIARALTLVALFAGLLSRDIRAQAKSTKQQGAVRDSVATAQPSHLAITAAIVMGDMTVRRLPTLALELVSESDSAARIPLRTSLDGTVAKEVPPGRYVVRSLTPVVLNDSVYQWMVPVEINGTTTDRQSHSAPQV